MVARVEGAVEGRDPAETSTRRAAGAHERAERHRERSEVGARHVILERLERDLGCGAEPQRGSRTSGGTIERRRLRGGGGGERQLEGEPARETGGKGLREPGKRRACGNAISTETSDRPIADPPNLRGVGGCPCA